MNKDSAAVRKRTQIAQASRTMFIWIAIASVLVGAAVVVSIFLFQKITYNEKVLGAKKETVKILTNNLSVIEGLKTEIRALDANSALLSVKANEGDETLQVVLDALPSEANSLALGASLQNKLLANVQGSFVLDSLQVTPVSGVEALETNSAVLDASAGAIDTTINFRFAVKGDQTALRQILENLERSIRTIAVTSASIEVQGSTLLLNIEGHAFYQPARVLELREEVVPNK